MKNKIKFYKSLSKIFPRHKIMEIIGCEPELSATQTNKILSQVYC